MIIFPAIFIIFFLDHIDHRFEAVDSLTTQLVATDLCLTCCLFVSSVTRRVSDVGVNFFMDQSMILMSDECFTLFIYFCRRLSPCSLHAFWFVLKNFHPDSGST